MEGLDIAQHEADGGSRVVAMRGTLDLFTADEARESVMGTIDQTRCDRLVVDLSETEFIDSSGLAVLIAVRKRMVREGGRMVLVCTDHDMRRVFSTTGLDQFLRL